MRILYIGDVMAESGIRVVERELPKLVLKEKIDFVIAQAENVSAGKGMNLADYARLKAAGVQAFTGGNHTTDDKELFPMLENPDEPVIGPANLPDCPGSGYKFIDSQERRVMIISLMGQVVGKDRNRVMLNPLETIDKILAKEISTERAATIVNFHGDYSSEKVVIGHYLDGRVTAVIGDHWHIPTADARILPGGTAVVTDVGMTGVLDSSLGVKYDAIIPRWRDGIRTKNELESAGRRQFNGVIIDFESSNSASSIIQVRQIFDI